MAMIELMPRETNSLRSLSAVPFSEKLPTWIQYSEAEAEVEALGVDGGVEGLWTAPELGVEPVAGLAVAVFEDEVEGKAGAAVDAGFSDD